MTVVTIRTHRRYAVRGPVQLAREDGTSSQGLMIEVAAHGCRVSNLHGAALQQGEKLRIIAQEGVELCASVRWAHDGVAGLKLDRPLHPRQMAQMVSAMRGEGDNRRYGT